MKFTKAQRSRCKIKMAVQGSSGSGKTYSSLLIAFGLTQDWNKIALIDTENGSGNLYSNLGSYSVLSLKPPFSPEAFSQAILLAHENGFECVIIDSLSAEWSGSGGILDIHANMAGNSFTNWSKLTPRHNTFVQTMLQSDLHVIGTMRSKTDYVLQDKNGKQVPEKVGLKSVQREDTEYEFTLVLELNHRNIATVSKDRTGLFKNLPEFRITEDTGKLINQWCNSGESNQQQVVNDFNDDLTPGIDGLLTKINNCKTVQQLKDLFAANPDKQEQFRPFFIARRNEINLSNPQNVSLNGLEH
jgi:hypothetical protein